MIPWADSKVDDAVKSKFQDVADLYDAWKNDRSSNLERLKFRLDAMYERFTLDEKKQFTTWMIDSGKLDQKIVDTLLVFGGSLHKLT